MPQEPKKRHSRQRQGKRRAHITLSMPAVILCADCKKPILPHTVCKYCGWYAGKRLIFKEKHLEKESKKPGNEKERRSET